MWFDDHPYILIYIIGCMATILLSLFQLAFFSLVNWIIKAHILVKNIKKIEPPDMTSALAKLSTFTVLLLIGATLSLINVPIVLWQIMIGLLKTFRELFSSVPEEIKLLRYPLRNNPNLSREAMWAHIWALRIKNGEEWDSELIYQSLNELIEYYPSFSSSRALTIFRDLKIIDPVLQLDMTQLQIQQGE